MQRLLGTRSPIFGSSSSSPGSEVVRPSNRDVVLLQDPSHNPQTGIIIAKIEEILAANLDALRENRALTIPIRNRRTGRLRLVRFPSSRDTDAKKFTALLQILHLSHEALVAGTVITKRAIYYQNPELFGNQQYVDQLVDDIAFTLGFGRDALNIVATSKGLVAGAVNITISNGSSLSCNSEDGKGVLLPDVRVITGITLGAVEWLLVIEKEATFRGLAASNFHESAKVGRGILITAKGYPDLSTRQFLHKLYATFPMMPMFGLVDFDPDGIKIFATYKNGSRSLQHEENTTLNRLSWIGPRSGDIFGHYHRNSASTDSNQTNVFHLTPSQEFSLSQPNASPYPSIAHSPIEVTLPLTARDRRSATRLLSATVGKDDAESLDFIRELQVMLLINTKAEIQAVDEAGDLSAWLDNALTKAMRGV
ncbi:DNA topoisomerase IV, alpha subunit [Nemania sp. FL0031]|nr:DNA topoisomerase IV, alpha subunit [Nemania sp. FL0031]